MRVSLASAEKTEGLVFKTHLVEVTVDVVFSEEELASIKHRKLQKAVLVERQPHRSKAKKYNAEELEMLFNLTVGDLMRGPDKFLFDGPVEAKNYEEEVKNALKNLKSHIEANATVGQKETFEL